MGKKEQYEKAKQLLIEDATICRPNRTLFANFLDYEEYKLKRKNGLAGGTVRSRSG